MYVCVGGGGMEGVGLGFAAEIVKKKKNEGCIEKPGSRVSDYITARSSWPTLEKQHQHSNIVVISVEEKRRLCSKSVHGYSLVCLLITREQQLRIYTGFLWLVVGWLDFPPSFFILSHLRMH